MRIFELMTEGVVTVPPTLTVGDAAELMRQKGICHLVVKRDGKIAGVLSDRDVQTPAFVNERVTEVMTAPAVTIGPHETVRTAANRMRSRGVSSLPVVLRGQLIGIVTVTDLLRVLGRGADRPTPRTRTALHHRSPHHKQGRAPSAW